MEGDILKSSHFEEVKSFVIEESINVSQTSQSGPNRL